MGAVYPIAISLVLQVLIFGMLIFGRTAPLDLWPLPQQFLERPVVKDGTQVTLILV